MRTATIREHIAANERPSRRAAICSRSGRTDRPTGSSTTQSACVVGEHGHAGSPSARLPGPTASRSPAVGRSPSIVGDRRRWQRQSRRDVDTTSATAPSPTPTKRSTPIGRIGVSQLRSTVVERNFRPRQVRPVRALREAAQPEPVAALRTRRRSTGLAGRPKCATTAP